MPPPIVQTKVSPLQSTGSPYSFTVEVDYFDVDKLYNLVMEKASGPSLYTWLTTEGHQYLKLQAFKKFSGDNDWEPLADATQDIRSAMGVPAVGPINIRTALLGNRNSLSDFVFDSYEASMGPDFAELDMPGRGDPIQQDKLRTAQQGSDNNPLGYGPTPARPVLPDADEEDLQTLLHMLEGWIMVEVAGALV